MIDLVNEIAAHETSTDERLIRQLAEECSELNKACIKYLRAIDPGDATPVTKEDALNNIFEEMADIETVEMVLGATGFINDGAIYDWIDKKTDRWYERLMQKGDNDDELHRNEECGNS